MAVVTPPTCTDEGYTTHTCSRCDDSYIDTAISATGHSFSDATCDAPKTCGKCGATEGSALGHNLVDVAGKAATCTDPGYTAYKACSRCTHIEGKEVIPAKGHTIEILAAVAATCTATGLTEGERCSVCNAILSAQIETPKIAHAWSDWTETKAPTENEAGEKTRECASCHAVETNTIPALSHNCSNYPTVALPAVAPTCTETGLTAGTKCSECGAIITAQETVAALGHDLIDVAGKDATCTEAGYTAHKACSRCTYTVGRDAISAAHTPGDAATCSNAQICTVCNAELAPALAHAYGEWSVTTAPTKYATGLLTRTCSADAEHTVTFTLPKLNMEDYTYADVSDTLARYTYMKDGQTFAFEVSIVTPDEFISGGVIVIVPGGLAPGHDISVDDVTADTDDEIDVDGKDADVLVAYDIYFLKDGDHSDVNGNFTVKLPIPKEYLGHKEEHLLVIHIADDGTITVIENAYRDGDYMVFDTTHFSVYAIISIAPSYAWVWWVLAIVAVLIIAALVVIILLQRKKDGKKPTGGAAEIPAKAAVEPTKENTEAITVTEPEKAPKTVKAAVETPEEPKAVAAVAPIAEAPVAPVAEAPKTTVAEAPKAPVAEAVVEKTPEPVVAATPEVAEAVPVVIDDKAKVVSAVVDGEEVQIRLRRSMKSRLIQTDEKVQQYYSVIKNHLLSYKKVKSRESWNYEAFNKGRIKCAQINVKGKTLIVNLNLDPKEFNIAKYHFSDMSAKPKYAKMPLMMKVRSDRALKYTIELIDEMMKRLEIAQGEIPTVDYRMPYESTEELIKRGLIKVMLPEGVVLSDDMKLVHTDISKHIEGNTDKVAPEAVEEPAVVEESAEEPEVAAAPEVAEAVPVVIDDKAKVVSAVVDGEEVQIRLRRSMKSRLIQTDEKVQQYYSAIKNHLLSYKKVKSRESWNYEAFNKGRIKCAQINVKGKTLIVNLNLDPKEFNIAKYHFADMSAKPKYAKMPLMMKVRSDRALKYTIELIDEMMKRLEIAQGEIPTVDYRMPYESTEELIKRGLIKVMLPEGVVLSDDMKLVHTDISKHIEGNADKAQAPAQAEEIGEAVSAVVEESAEEPEVVEEVTEEPEMVEEATEEPEAVEEPELVEEVTEEATEEPKVVEETAEEPEVVCEKPEAIEATELHVDAVTADRIISNAEAEKLIEVVHTDIVLNGKMGEINLDVICENFEDGDTVDIRALRAKRLVAKNVGKIKVLARGTMTKRLVIVANKFSLQAVKMITLAGGKAELDV